MTANCEICSITNALECHCVPRDQLYARDALDFLDHLPDNSVDVIIADPPYHISHRDNFNLKDRTPIKRDFGSWDFFKNADAYWTFTQAWVEKAIRKLKEGGTFYSFFDRDQINYLRDLAVKNGLYSKGYLFWHKTNPHPQIRKRDYLSSVETIFYGVKVPHQRPKDGKPFIFNFLGQNAMHNFIEVPITMGNERLKHPTEKNGNGRPTTLHATQKPEKIIERLIRVSSNEGDLVIDPFMGTGTTPAVAKRLCRHYLATDIDPLYVQAAEDRVGKIPFCEHQGVLK